MFQYLYFKMKTIIEKEILKDLAYSFEKFIEKNEPKELNTLLQILFHSKAKKMFNFDFYEYWLNKLLSLSFNQGSYILCVPSVINQVFEMNEKELGNFLSKKIDFLIAINDFERVVNWLTLSLQGNVIYEKSWLINIITYIGIEDSEKLIEENNRNEAFFLNKVLKIK